MIMTQLPSERDILIRRYEDIPTTDFHGLIVFYESYEPHLRSLNSDLHALIFTDYLGALDLAGHYSKYYTRVDEEISRVISSVAEFDREQYVALVFKKAYAAHYLMQWDDATNILHRYIHLKRNCPKAKRLYIQNERRRLKSKSRWIYGLAIIFLLGMSAILLIEILVVEAFLDQFQNRVFWFRNALMLAAIGVLLGFEGWSTFVAYRKYNKALDLIGARNKEV